MLQRDKKSNRGTRWWQAARHRDWPSSGRCLIRMFVRLKSTKIKLCHRLCWMTKTHYPAGLDWNKSSGQEFDFIPEQITECQFYRLTVCVVWGLWPPIFGYCFVLSLSFLFFKEAWAAVFSFKGKTYFHMCWYRKNAHTFKQNNLSIVHPLTHLHMPVSMQFH